LLHFPPYRHHHRHPFQRKIGDPKKHKKVPYTEKNKIVNFRPVGLIPRNSKIKENVDQTDHSEPNGERVEDHKFFDILDEAHWQSDQVYREGVHNPAQTGHFAEKVKIPVTHNFLSYQH
jgi:hypothetical protein